MSMVIPSFCLFPKKVSALYGYSPLGNYRLPAHICLPLISPTCHVKPSDDYVYSPGGYWPYMFFHSSRPPSVFSIPTIIAIGHLAIPPFRTWGWFLPNNHRHGLPLQSGNYSFKELSKSGSSHLGTKLSLPLLARLTSDEHCPVRKFMPRRMAHYSQFQPYN